MSVKYFSKPEQGEKYCGSFPSHSVLQLRREKGKCVQVQKTGVFFIPVRTTQIMST